jgi:hypothetical protein
MNEDVSFKKILSALYSLHNTNVGVIAPENIYLRVGASTRNLLGNNTVGCSVSLQPG